MGGNAADEGTLFFIPVLPPDPLRRVFVTPGPTKPNYFSGRRSMLR